MTPHHPCSADLARHIGLRNAEDAKALARRMPPQHEVATGVDCEGYLIVQERGELADLACNVCDAVVDTVPIGKVPIGRAGARLMELASSEICGAHCPHCGALNTFPGFSAIEAFICVECGEGVTVSGFVQ
jgi:hypothetical protein